MWMVTAVWVFQAALFSDPSLLIPGVSVVNKGNWLVNWSLQPFCRNHLLYIECELGLTTLFEGNLTHPKICKNNCKLYFSNDHFWLPPFPHYNCFLKHFSLIFMFVLKQNCLLQYVCFYSLVQDPKHCINKLLMKREFYKLKFSVLFIICV